MDDLLYPDRQEKCGKTRGPWEITSVVGDVELREYLVSEVGRFVRQRRKANGMTQADLAALARVGVRFISELERGKQSVRLDAVNSVLHVFGKRLGVVPIKRGASSE